MIRKQYWSIGIPVFLLVLNFFLVWPWFQDGYPSYSASLEPALIAQARFIKNNWPDVAWDGAWYLGLPFRFIGSPFLPYFLAFFNSLMPSVSFWLAYRVVTGVGIVVLPVGLFFLARDFNRGEGKNFSALLAALIFSLFPALIFLFPQVFTIGRQFGWWPWQYILLVLLGNGRKILGLAILPFCLLAVNRYLKGQLKGVFWPVLLLVILALVDLGSIVTLLVLSVLLVVSYMMVGRLKKKIKRLFLILVLSLGILSVFYPPRFWFQALTAPSLAGKGVFSVVVFLARLLSILIPLGLGILSAKFIKKKKENYFLFIFLWVFVYSFLTIARFVADIDFWQDYAAWGIELMMGVSLLAAALLTKNSQSQIPIFKLSLLIAAIFTSSLLWLGKRNKLLAPRLDISQTVEAKVAQELEKKVKPGERVFVSGSPVFWLNALSDVAQVRGGADQAANHPWWDHAAYQVRVGTEPTLAAGWLKALGVSWLMVHGPASAEPYHDFENLDRFKDESFALVWEENDNRLYQLQSSLAREVNDLDSFLKLESSSDGADIEAITAYNRFLAEAVSLRKVRAGEWVVNARSQNAISLALTYDLGWQAWQNGQHLKIKKDSLGQVIILPIGKGEITMVYRYPWLDQLGGILLCGIAIFFIISSKRLLIKK